MKKRLTILALLLVFALLLCACSGSSTESNTGTTGEQSTGNQSPAAEQKPLTIGTINRVETFDVTQSQMWVDGVNASLIHASLTRYNKDVDGKYEPDVLESIEMAEDGMSAVLTVRDGVKFSNGEVLDAEDIVFTLTSYSQSPYRASYYTNFASFEATDALHVNVKFFRPMFAHKLDFVFSVTYVLPNEYCTEKGIEEFAKNPIFSGPYVISNYDEAAGNIKYTRNPDYYGTPAIIETVKLRFIQDASAATISLEKGEIDYMQPQTSQYNTISTFSNVTTKFQASPVFGYITLNTEQEPFNDPVVRKAFAHAVDREGIAISYSGGNGYRLLDYFWLQYWGEQPANLEPAGYEFDTTKAKKMLEDAGYTLPIDLGSMKIIPSVANPAVVLQQNLLEAGFKVEIEQIDVSAYIPMLMTGDYKVNFMMGFSFDDDPVTGLDNYFTIEQIGLMNFPRYNNPELEKTIKAGIASIDATERYELAAQALNIMCEEVPVVPICSMDQLVVTAKNLVIPQDHIESLRVDTWYWAE